MLLNALNDWNTWWKDESIINELSGKDRIASSELKKLLDIKEIKIVTGIRRAGKSTLFYQLIKHLLKKGVKKENILLINFEDEVLSKHTLKEIVDVYHSNISPTNDFYLFLDEVHRCNEWELFVRKLYDTRGVKQIFITDSSSKFISKEYAQVFTGRNVKFITYPLSFKEYLTWAGLDFEIKKMSSLDKNKAKRMLKEYSEYGGFPEVFIKSKPFKKMILKEYFYDILYKDVVERFDIDVHKAEEFLSFLLSNIANPFSVRKYSREKKLSLESVEKYLKCFEDVFLLFRVPKFSYSTRTQQICPKKIYSIDHGLSNAVGFKFSKDVGRVYENIVFIGLKHKLPPNSSIYYWKRKREVDFVVKEGLNVKRLIQVCRSVEDVETKKRETEGLIQAMKEFKLKEGLIITEDYEAEEEFKGRKIKFISLWKWLLSMTFFIF